MEKNSRERLLDAALEVLGRSGASGLTVRAIEDSVGLPHGSVRHHFGDRMGLVAALFDHLADREGEAVDRGAAGAVEHWLGPGRDLTLARYELFLMAARDPALRPPLVRARERFVAAAAQRVGAAAAPTVVAAVDGLVLDALVRGSHDPDQLRSAIASLLDRASRSPTSRPAPAGPPAPGRG